MCAFDRGMGMYACKRLGECNEMQYNAIQCNSTNGTVADVSYNGNMSKGLRYFSRSRMDNKRTRVHEIKTD